MYRHLKLELLSSLLKFCQANMQATTDDKSGSGSTIGRQSGSQWCLQFGNVGDIPSMSCTFGYGRRVRAMHAYKSCTASLDSAI